MDCNLYESSILRCRSSEWVWEIISSIWGRIGYSEEAFCILPTVYANQQQRHKDSNFINMRDKESTALGMLHANRIEYNAKLTY